MKNKKKIITSCLLLISCFISSQEFSHYIEKLKVYNLEAISDFQSNNQLSKREKSYIQFQILLISSGIVEPVDSLQNKTKNNSTTLFHLQKGDFYLFKEISNDSLAFKSYVKALELSEKNNDTLLITESCRKLMHQLYKSRRALEVYPLYLSIYNEYLYDDNEKSNYIFHYYNHKTAITRIANTKELKEGLNIVSNTDNTYLKGKYHQLIGLFYQYYVKQLDSALSHQFKALKELKKKDYAQYRNELYGVNANIGLIYQNKAKYNLAESYFIKASQIKIPNYKYLEKVKIKGLIATNYYLKKDYKNAYDYIIEQNKYNDTLNEYNRATKVNEISTKYQTEKKEKENLKLKNFNLISEQERKKNFNIAISLAGSLALGSIIAFLIYKNTKRKQKLAEQQKEIETQKLATVLKEQELTSIDAMIEGQEKERQRIANDLHDDLGGLMATVKLHFNALKDKKSPELFDKTNALIDEAYHKVRSVAHAKNSGVIAKHGLLKSVQEMADKISISNQLEIEVIDFGLETRLENSLELTIFRIIQELVSNAVKHAEASEISIHITNHEDSLNLMVEDNGKGFNPNQITKNNNGMGISSIDKRVEHLDGKMDIDSQINNGTTVIIDFPL